MLRILLVDDEAAITDNLAPLLRRPGAGGQPAPGAQRAERGLGADARRGAQRRGADPGGGAPALALARGQGVLRAGRRRRQGRRLLLSRLDHELKNPLTAMRVALANVRAAVGGETMGAVLPEGAEVLIEVTDTGPGIAAEDLPHVFEELYRSPRTMAVPGSGLGLPLVLAVVEAHGGTVVADSPPGRGLAVHVRLPVTG